MENESLTSSHRRRAIRDALRGDASSEDLDRVVLWQLYGVVRKIQKDCDLQSLFSACGNRRRLRELACEGFRHNGIDLLVDVLSEYTEARPAFKEFLQEEVRRAD